MDKKKCFKCGKTKSLTMFYEHPQMGDGHLNKCIECTKMDVSLRYGKKIKDVDFLVSERDRGREKYHRLYKDAPYIKNDDLIRRWQTKWKTKYPEKKKASSAAKRIKLEFEGAHRHHWSYNEEHRLDVIQLSVAHHYKAHRFLLYDDERMMYRGLDGVLLDTRERHLEYITYKIKYEKD